MQLAAHVLQTALKFATRWPTHGAKLNLTRQRCVNDQATDWDPSQKACGHVESIVQKAPGSHEPLKTRPLALRKLMNQFLLLDYRGIRLQVLGLTAR